MEMLRPAGQGAGVMTVRPQCVAHRDNHEAPFAAVGKVRGVPHDATGGNPFAAHAGERPPLDVDAGVDEGRRNVLAGGAEGSRPAGDLRMIFERSPLVGISPCQVISCGGRPVAVRRVAEVSYLAA
jgi:hypothetical protein